MVRVTFTNAEAGKRNLHWPRDYSPDQMQARVCWAFKLSIREYRASFFVAGKQLMSSTKPFASIARGSAANVEVVFEVLQVSEKLNTINQVADEDVSSGFSTPSEWESQMEKLDMCRQR